MRRPIILLDLGGVLADLADPVKSMQLEMTGEEFWQVWPTSPTVAAYETGRIDFETFVELIALELGTSEPDVIASRFKSWKLSIFPAVDNLIDEIADRFTLALLSNTNPIHWRQVRSTTDIFSKFDKLFLSFETGYFKPEPDAFAQVVDHFGCDAADVIFLDDSALNVASASKLGMRAEQVVGPTQLKELLTRKYALGNEGVR